MMNGFHVASSCPLTRERQREGEGKERETRTHTHKEKRVKEEYEMWDTHFGPLLHNFRGCIYSLWIQPQQWIWSMNQHHQSYSLLPDSEPWKRWSGSAPHTHIDAHWHAHTHGSDGGDPGLTPLLTPNLFPNLTPWETGAHWDKDTHAQRHTHWHIVRRAIWWISPQTVPCVWAVCVRRQCVCMRVRASVCAAIASAPSHWC